jgi:head-tail adaptor
MLNFHVGDLRWLVTLASRQENPDPNGTGVIETYVNPVQVYASIKPLGLQTYIGAEQIDTPLTHRVIIRWFDNLDMFDVVIRNIIRNDGSVRQELFRIRRVSEFEGRQRFVIFECELEQRQG